jgi:hypothetical protein
LLPEVFILKRTSKGKQKKIFVVGILISTLFSFYFSFYNNEIAQGFQSSLHGSPTLEDTYGHISVQNEGCCEGYTLLSTYFPILIDMNGTPIHIWKSFVPQPVKMLPGGSVILGSGMKVCGFSCSDVTILKELNWNGTITWSYSNWENGRARQHHDFEREGNPVGYYAPGQDFDSQGKTLVLAHQRIVNTSISIRKLTDDVIYEIDWNGTPTGFEWHASDHFNQMGFDNTTKHGMYVNPGILCDGDLLHINSMSFLGNNTWYSLDPINYSYFNPENIIISSRNTNIIAIISKQTGDIVWRVGPDYSSDSEYGRKLGQIIGLHHAHMIPQGLPGGGNILVFDNGGWAGYGYFGMPRYIRLWSRVIEFNPVTYDIVWQYSHPALSWWFPRTGENHRFFSYYISSAQRLPNGNTLITEGANGRVFEVTNTSKIVWEYVAPTRAQQLYRAYRIPPEWVPGNPSGYEFWGEK